MASENRRALWLFIAGVAASAIMGAVLAQTMETWLWMTITAVGMAVSGLWLITAARPRTDVSSASDDNVKDKKNA